MNSNVEKDLFGFPKVKWLHLTGEVDKSVRFSFQFSQDLTSQKLLKSVNFDKVIQKIKSGRFRGHGVDLLYRIGSDRIVSHLGDADVERRQ